LLRAENSDERLTPLGRELGLVDDRRWSAYEARRAQLDRIRACFEMPWLDGKSLREIARRPETTIDQVASRLAHASDRTLIERVITEARYDGYVTRQRAEIKRQTLADQQRIPDWMAFDSVIGLRAEAAETLRRFRPQTMGQAGRLAGLTPADLSLLAVIIRRGRTPETSDADH
jgi:tRNA uridine 5-carboxymethylaminomethyl modification enzyme